MCYRRRSTVADERHAVTAMDKSSRVAATADCVVVDGQQRLERPRSARRSSQRRPVNAEPPESRVSPSFSTTSTIDDDEDQQEFPVVFGDPPRGAHTCSTVNRMLKSTLTDQRSRSSSRSPPPSTAAGGAGLCLVDLAEARQRVLNRYDRKQRPPSSVGRHYSVDTDTRRSTTAVAGIDESGGIRRRQQRLEPLTVNVQAPSTLGVQHHQ